jgi:inorganic pyrophosphatase
MNGDTDWLFEIIELEDEDEKESAIETVKTVGENYAAIAELVDDEDEGRESVHFSRNLKRFRSDVKKFFGARNLKDEEKTTDIIEKSFHRLVEAMDDAKERLNELIDDVYDNID